MAITKDIGLMDLVQQYPDAIPVLMNAGMGCLGCAVAHFETLEQGASAHGIDVDALVEALNDAVGEA